MYVVSGVVIFFGGGGLFEGGCRCSRCRAAPAPASARQADGRAQTATAAEAGPPYLSRAVLVLMAITHSSPHDFSTVHCTRGKGKRGETKQTD